MKNFFLKFRFQILAILLAVSVILIDRMTEHAVSFYIQNSEGFVKITPFFNLVWTGNDGISFGMLQDLAYGKWLLSISAFIITGFFFIWLFFLIFKPSSIRSKASPRVCGLGPTYPRVCRRVSCFSVGFSPLQVLSFSYLESD